MPAPPVGPPPDDTDSEGDVPPPPPLPEEDPRPPAPKPPVRGTPRDSAPASSSAATSVTTPLGYEPTAPVTPPLGPRKHPLERPQTFSSPFLPMPTRLPERLAVDATVVQNVMFPSCNLLLYTVNFHFQLSLSIVIVSHSSLADCLTSTTVFQLQDAS